MKHADRRNNCQMFLDQMKYLEFAKLFLTYFIACYICQSIRGANLNLVVLLYSMTLQM
jgi:hypothetical protein